MSHGKVSGRDGAGGDERGRDEGRARVEKDREERRASARPSGFRVKLVSLPAKCAAHMSAPAPAHVSNRRRQCLQSRVQTGASAV
eukprot:1142501-Rhodomonas_salina.4